MSEWSFDKTITTVKKYNIYSMMSNFLRYNKQFRSLRPDKSGICEICDTPFKEDEIMVLALNKGKEGNLLICDICCKKAIEKGVPCTDRQK